MSIRVMTRDTEALPDDLLTPAKEHMRVDHSEDNNFIKSCIARAISKLEADLETTIHPTSVRWTITSADFANGVANVPVVPAFSAVVMDGETDVSSAYSLALKFNSIHGIPIQVLEGAAGTLTVTLECGFDVDTLPPDLLDEVLSLAGHLFDHREILVPGREFVRPDLRGKPWWKPRV